MLLVDEINRMPPRTQSALLEAMEEVQVTIDGTSHALPRTFTVFATQNPVEFEGTYPLARGATRPLPDEDSHRISRVRRGSANTGALSGRIRGQKPRPRAARSRSRAGLAICAGRSRAQSAWSRNCFDYIVSIVRATRNSPAVSLGASPRAAISMMLVGKAIAAIEGRDFLIPDDVKVAAPPILRHRMMLKPEADLEGITSDQVVAEVLSATAVPQ